MKHIFTLLLASFCISAFSQITINSSHMPKAGDTIRYSIAASLGKTAVSKTGTDQTWDFTDLKVQSQAIEEYKSSLQTPYVLNFGFSALGLKLADTLGAASFQFQNMYNFYKNSTASFTDVGLGFQFSSFPIPQSGKHSDPDEIYTFPCKYPNRDSTTFKVNVPISVGIPVGSFLRQGTRINTVDGWGKISTPYASNVDCIRIKSVITEYDSISVSMANLNFGTTTTRVEYKWVSTTEKIPMLLISGTELTGTFTPTNIRFRDNYRQIGPTNVVKANFSADATTVGKGQVISLTDLSDGQNLNYQWKIQPSMAMFVNGTSASSQNPKIVINDTGYYAVRLLISSGSAQDSLVKANYLHVVESSNVLDVPTSHFSIYPNPTNNHLNISVPLEMNSYHIKIFDAQGKMIYSSAHKPGDNIETKTFAKGPYHLIILDEISQLKYQTTFIQN